jgi:hypothetical protein
MNNIPHLWAIHRVRTTPIQEKEVTSFWFNQVSDLLLFLLIFKTAFQGNEVPKTILYIFHIFPKAQHA